LGRWYDTHLDPREMSDFNPMGWTASFCRIADMLEINRKVCGAAGVSWYYDPKVGEISPALAYLRSNQVDNGAFSLRLGPARNTRKTPSMGRAFVSNSMKRENTFRPPS